MNELIRYTFHRWHFFLSCSLASTQILSFRPNVYTWESSLESYLLIFLKSFLLSFLLHLKRKPVDNKDLRIDMLEMITIWNITILLEPQCISWIHTVKNCVSEYHFPPVLNTNTVSHNLYLYVPREYIHLKITRYHIPPVLNTNTESYLYLYVPL